MRTAAVNVVVLATAFRASNHSRELYAAATPKSDGTEDMRSVSVCRNSPLGELTLEQFFEVLRHCGNVELAIIPGAVGGL